MHIPSSKNSSKNIFNCSLCAQITFGVFALILVVESVLLIPSAQRFRLVEKERIAQNIQTAINQTIALDQSQSIITSAPASRGLATLVSKLQLEGLLMRRLDGGEIARAGVADFKDAALSMDYQSIDTKPRLNEGAQNKLFITWKTTASPQVLLTASVDIAYINRDLNRYLLRIAGLVLVIVFVVTFGTMVLLYYMLLKPILRLRESAIAAGRAPKTAARFALPLTTKKRRDELDDLIEAHNGLLVQVTDSMQREALYAEQRALYIERHDKVSGLPNKIALAEYLDRFDQNEVQQTPLTLFLIELRNHSLSSTDVAAKFGEELSRLANARELVAKLGPSLFALVRLDEFSQQKNSNSHAQLAEQIIRLAQMESAASANTFLCDISIGIVEATPNTPGATVLLSHAEFALNRARTDPATRYQFFDQASANEALDRQRLTIDLARAIREKEIAIWFQPKVSLQHGHVLSGAEALIRWPHPTRGLLSPALFVPLAEETGQIEALDLYVFQAVCTQLSDWHCRYQNVPRIAVNIAAQTFARANLVSDLIGAINTAAIKPKDVEVEITETAAMKNIEQTITTLSAIRKLGIHTAIDDFGTGYSSLSYLRRFELDTLKIDRSFVEDIGRNPNVEAICGVIVQLGLALGTRVVAEGVETETQADFLRQRGCDDAQGYLYSRPIPADAFAATWLIPK